VGESAEDLFAADPVLAKLIGSGRWVSGFSVAMRMTSLRIAAAVDGRPGRRWLV
jgi:hypothetical protein